MIQKNDLSKISLPIAPIESVFPIVASTPWPHALPAEKRTVEKQLNIRLLCKAYHFTT